VKCAFFIALAFICAVAACCTPLLAAWMTHNGPYWMLACQEGVEPTVYVDSFSILLCITFAVSGFASACYAVECCE
jgi:formate hydrogenlyase subunit 3/multisubunit Na+/H+ antiporter MnhD subunit